MNQRTVWTCEKCNRELKGGSFCPEGLYCYNRNYRYEKPLQEEIEVIRNRVDEDDGDDEDDSYDAKDDVNEEQMDVIDSRVITESIHNSNKDENREESFRKYNSVMKRSRNSHPSNLKMADKKF